MFPKMWFCDGDDYDDDGDDGVNKTQIHVFLIFLQIYTSQIHKVQTHEWFHEVVVVFLHLIWHLWAVFCRKDLRDVAVTA